MTAISIKGGLPFVSVHLSYQSKSLVIDNVLIDSGSAGSVFQADRLLDIDLRLDPQDIIREIRGVGGTEFVFSKQVEALKMGNFEITDFDIEVGAMNYGFEIDGIVGMNFLLKVGAIVDFDRLVVRRPLDLELPGSVI